jgi:hypothetical protein
VPRSARQSGVRRGASREHRHLQPALACLGVGGHRLKAGTKLAPSRVTVGLDGHRLHVIANGTLARTALSPPADQ